MLGGDLGALWTDKGLAGAGAERRDGDWGQHEEAAKPRLSARYMVPPEKWPSDPR